MILKESDLRRLVREVMGISGNVIEFETAMGSIYTYDRNLRMCSREKRSGGSGLLGWGKGSSRGDKGGENGSLHLDIDIEISM